MRNRFSDLLLAVVFRGGGSPFQLDVGRSAFSVGRLLEFYLHL